VHEPDRRHHRQRQHAHVQDPDLVHAMPRRHQQHRHHQPRQQGTARRQQPQRGGIAGRVEPAPRADQQHQQRHVRNRLLEVEALGDVQHGAGGHHHDG
jgi:hypothetical protein